MMELEASGLQGQVYTLDTMQDSELTEFMQAVTATSDEVMPGTVLYGDYPLQPTGITGYFYTLPGALPLPDTTRSRNGKLVTEPHGIRSDLIATNLVTPSYQKSIRDSVLRQERMHLLISRGKHGKVAVGHINISGFGLHNVGYGPQYFIFGQPFFTSFENAIPLEEIGIPQFRRGFIRLSEQQMLAAVERLKDRPNVSTEWFAAVRKNHETSQCFPPKYNCPFATLCIRKEP